jgi:diguanylate cyclase (GGDEF)-like protein
MYWRRSLTTATVARLLALRIDKDLGDAAFVGGLLCDIGILAATQYAEEVYLPAIASYRQGEKPLHAVEQETLGLTHEDLSTTLLKHWSLPDEICQAVQTHHHPLTPDSARRDAEPILTRILRASALLADLFVGDTLAGNLPHVTQQVAQGIPLPEEDLDNVLKNLDGQVQEIASMLELDIGSTLAYHEIQAAATTQLASLSMEAELHAQKLANQNRKLAEEATTDKLTGIANRAALDDHFAAVCKRCRDNQSPIALILLDLDHFKRINDTFGHTAGDQVLSHVGQVLKQFQSTSRLAGRYGGEEFAVVAENITKEQLRTLAESIRTKVARITVPNDAKPVRVTASLGAAHMKPGDPNLSVATLIERADTCLYQAKNSGRNRVMYAGSRRVIDLETEQAAAS